MDPSQLTQAVLFESDSKEWRTVHVPLPDPQHDEILVRVLACTICGSDLHSVSGRRSVPSPIILGHEIVGEIVAFGPTSSRQTVDGRALQEGDRIVWALVANCGECFFCSNGLPQKCEQSFKYGHAKFESPRHLAGGFAEHCLLVSGTKCVKVPADLPLEIACPIGCSMATAAAAIEFAHPNGKSSALVLGGGLVGLMVCAMLKSRGVTNIVCVEPNEIRRELALRFGATTVASQLDSATAKQLTQSRGFDCAIECSGSNAAFELGFQHVRTGGNFVLVGSVFPGPGVPVVLDQIVRRNISIFGVHNYRPDHLVQAAEFATTAGRLIDPSLIVSQWFTLDELPTAFHSAIDAKALRVGIRAK